MRAGIVGYGNLGKGVEAAVNVAEDMELVCVVTRRNPETLKINSDVPVISYDDIDSMVGNVDVMIICGGSAVDLPEMTPYLATKFNVIDSFDTHARIPEHFAKVDANARQGGNIGIISVGWDPGLFSVLRVYGESILPRGKSYTFWGRGVSQGHSDAIRRIDGVIDARQYTVPVEGTLEKVRQGSKDDFSTRQMHTRECFVVVEENADKAEIERQIVNMPNYFADYDTSVTFISPEEMEANHKGIPHGGKVMRIGNTGEEGEFLNTVEFSLELESNPFFTASVLVATARAVKRFLMDGVVGCKTIFDIPPAYLSELSDEELRAGKL